MKANQLNLMHFLLEERGKNTQTIHYKKISKRTISFFRDYDKKPVGTYTHHPFLDKEGYIYGVFKVSSFCSEATLENIVKSYKKYWKRNKSKFMSEVLPGFNSTKKPLKGFKFSLWKGENDNLVKVLINSDIEIDFISQYQIGFKVSKERDYHFTYSIGSKDKGSVNYENLESAHASFLERKICLNPKIADLEKLTTYIGSKDPERADYYKLIYNLS